MDPKFPPVKSLHKGACKQQLLTINMYFIDSDVSSFNVVRYICF